jgi:Bifunctional DNA primase/polymerase, N-terminal
MVLSLRQRGLFPIPVHPETRLPLVAWGHVDTYGYPDGPRFRGGAVIGCDLPYAAWLFHWADQYPGCGWAVLCGRSGLLCVDVDPRNGGDISLRELAAEVDLPATLTWRTRGGGAHLVYRTPKLVKSSTGKLAKGLDVLSYRKLATAPPTPGYELLDDRPVAEVPAALLARCPAPARGGGRRRERLPLSDPVAGAALAYAVRRIGETGEGERHDRLYGQARHLYEVTLDTRVDARLLEVALEVGLPRAEATRTIGDARRAAGG